MIVHGRPGVLLMTAMMGRITMIMPVKGDTVRRSHRKPKSPAENEPDKKHWNGTIHERVRPQA
ncbi:hypothetical protein [Roseovarius sp.]|uniref:hypothetical protein n=1 Tax=Roseovarius sp. TaxID=1486281 RepID=UPI003D0F69DA